MFNPRLQRFNQRDIAGGLYTDGMNTYAAYHVLEQGLDPTGMNKLRGVNALRRVKVLLQQLGHTADEIKKILDGLPTCLRGLVQEHHIINRATFRNHRFLNDIGMDVQSKANRIVLPKPGTRNTFDNAGAATRNTSTHNNWTRTHSEYNQYVDEQIADIGRQLEDGLDPAQARKLVEDLQSEIRDDLMNGRIDLGESATGAWDLGAGVVVVGGLTATNADGETINMCAEDTANALQQLGALMDQYAQLQAEIASLAAEAAYAMTPIADVEDIVTGGPKIVEEVGNIIDAASATLDNTIDQIERRRRDTADAALNNGRGRDALDDAIDRRSGR